MHYGHACTCACSHSRVKRSGISSFLDLQDKISCQLSPRHPVVSMLRRQRVDGGVFAGAAPLPAGHPQQGSAVRPHVLTPKGAPEPPLGSLTVTSCLCSQPPSAPHVGTKPSVLPAALRPHEPGQASDHLCFPSPSRDSRKAPLAGPTTGAVTSSGPLHLLLPWECSTPGWRDLPLIS